MLQLDPLGSYPGLARAPDLEITRFASPVGKRVLLPVLAGSVRHRKHVAALPAAKLGAIRNSGARIPSGRWPHGLASAFVDRSGRDRGPEEEGPWAARREAGISTGIHYPVRRGIVTLTNVNCQRCADFMGGGIEKVEAETGRSPRPRARRCGSRSASPSGRPNVNDRSGVLHPRIRRAASRRRRGAALSRRNEARPRRQKNRISFARH
jgi:hypothetical protein